MSIPDARCIGILNEHFFAFFVVSQKPVDRNACNDAIFLIDLLLLLFSLALLECNEERERLFFLFITVIDRHHWNTISVKRFRWDFCFVRRQKEIYRFLCGRCTHIACPNFYRWFFFLCNTHRYVVLKSWFDFLRIQSISSTHQTNLRPDLNCTALKRLLIIKRIYIRHNIMDLLKYGSDEFHNGSEYLRLHPNHQVNDKKYNTARKRRLNHPK